MSANTIFNAGEATAPIIQANNIQKGYDQFHVLQGIDLEVYPQEVVVLMGPSGSGKSTLVKQILYPALKKMYGDYIDVKAKYGSITGSTNRLKKVEFVENNGKAKERRRKALLLLVSFFLST